MKKLEKRLRNIATQAREHLHNNVRAIISILRDCVKCMSEGRKEKDSIKVVEFLALLLSILTLLILVGLFILKTIIQSRYILGAAALFVLAAFSIKSEEPKPTEKDYQDVLNTVRPAVAAVALPLNLAPIDSNTNMEVGPEECIQPWKGRWRFVYKALKRNTAPIDSPQYLRAIQGAVNMTLKQSNPAGFPEIRLKFGEKTFPIIMVDDIKNEDTYIYIFAVICTHRYLEQKFGSENNTELLTKKDDTDDIDF